MSCQDCLAIGIPERLCKNGKPNVDIWEPSEILYRRHNIRGNKEELKENPDVETNLFQIHDDSYNRSSLSEPEDVLFNDNPEFGRDIYSNYGIISIPVSELMKECVHQINNDNRVFKLMPVHDSKDCNYSHSEIHCMVDGEKALKKPRSVNTVFRQILIKMFDVIKEAS